MRCHKLFLEPIETSVGDPLIDTSSAGVHRSPETLFRDAIERALGWNSEDKLRDLVFRYTKVKISLGEANRFSQEVADIVIQALRGEI